MLDQASGEVMEIKFAHLCDYALLDASGKPSGGGTTPAVLSLGSLIGGTAR